MDNAELLKQLGWSDALIEQVTQISKGLPDVRQPAMAQTELGYVTSTTTSATYSLETVRTYTRGSITI